MAATRGLAARYRRLLTWFPPEHRAEHGEEMVGVLLAASEPGRQRPSRAESTNLMLSGLRLRLRPSGALTDGDGWRDALAIFSVLMPILLLAASCATVLTERAQEGWWGNPLGIVSSLIIDGQLLLVPLVLLGLRRLAVVGAVGPLALIGYLIALNFARGFGEMTVGVDTAYLSWLLIVGVLEVVALLGSPGPRRGLELLRGRRWAFTAAAVVPAAVVMGGTLVLRRAEPLSSTFGPRDVIDVASIWAVAGFTLGVVWLSSALGQRLAVLFAPIPLAYLTAATLNTPAEIRSSATPDVLAVCSEVAIALVAVVTVRRLRRRSRP